jgi:Lrp/AsnC family transcriptional regulator
MDKLDYQILRTLQSDASSSNESIAADVGLSTMAVWRRVRRLEDEGVIKGRVALLDAKKLGRPVTAFVMLRTQQHGAEWFQRLQATIADIPEVMEFHRLSGEIDFMLKVSLRDLDDYQDFYRKLTAQVELMDVSTAFAFEQIKSTHELPI